MGGNLTAGSLNVDTSALNNVASNFSEVAAQVREIFTKMQGTIEQVTSNDSWQGDASRAFLDKFENIRPRFEQHLQQLEDLGPATQATSNGYATAEEDNVSMIGN